MTPRAAGETVRGWIASHTRAVLNTLACCDVPRDERPDLAQDVFLTAYGILLRSLFTVESPRAWLCAIAKRIASHYRREPGRRLNLAPVEESSSALADPEQAASQREFVRLLLEQLDEEARGVVLDVRAEGLTWEEVAQERGLTVPRAKYIYRVAVQRMEAACGDTAPGSRRSFVLALALDHTFKALRAEADVSPALRDRIWSSIEEAIDGATPMSANEPANGPRPRSISIQIHAGSSTMSAGPVLGLLAGGIAVGLMLAWLLRPPGAEVPAPVKGAPSASSHTVVVDEPPPTRAGVETTAFRFATNEAVEARRDTAPRVASTPARTRPTLAPRRRPSGAFALLDQARAAVDADDALEALAVLAQHARRFPRGPGAAERQHLLLVACAIPAARGALACAGVPSSLVHE
jgi:RNA polymerase sigma-70 factor (ECF subfamily)